MGSKLLGAMFWGAAITGIYAVVIKRLIKNGLTREGKVEKREDRAQYAAHSFAE